MPSLNEIRATYLDFTPNDRVKALEDELRGLESNELRLF